MNNIGNHIGVFLNDRIENISEHESSRSPNDLLNKAVKFGNWCLTPVRYLCNGNKVTITYKKGGWVSGKHEKEYFQCEEKTQRFFKGIASLVLIIPGLIAGSLFKGLGYLSQPIREGHRLAVIHYAPTDIIIGSPENRLSLKEVEKEIIKESSNKTGYGFYQWTKNLIVYLPRDQPTHIMEDPGFMKLNPQRIILDGTRISLCNLFQKNLVQNNFETAVFGSCVNHFIVTKSVKSVDAALKRSSWPFPLSLFLSTYRQVYVVMP